MSVGRSKECAFCVLLRCFVLKIKNTLEGSDKKDIFLKVVQIHTCLFHEKPVAKVYYLKSYVVMPTVDHDNTCTVQSYHK